MQIETINDVLTWTQHTHQELANCLYHCAEQSDRERLRVLLDYLAEHEQRLATTLERYKGEADHRVLDTWCLEYFDKRPVQTHQECNQPFDQMDTKTVVKHIVSLHEQLVSLYQYLSGRAETGRTRELFDDMANLEQHESMVMVRDANWLEDI